MTLDWPLAARAINDAASLTWFGLALAPVYGGPRFILGQRIAGVLALVSLAGFAAFTIANIVDPGGSLGVAEVSTILGQTSFGHIWLLRGVLCIAAIVLASNTRASAVLAGLQLALLGFGGHAFARGGVMGASIEALHLLASGGLGWRARRARLAAAARLDRRRRPILEAGLCDGESRPDCRPGHAGGDRWQPRSAC